MLVRREPERSRVGVSPSGKAAGFDPAIRRFESFHPSHTTQEPAGRRAFRVLWRGGRITSAVLGVAASVVGPAVVADWFAPLLVLSRRGRPRRGEARRAE